MSSRCYPIKVCPFFYLDLLSSLLTFLGVAEQVIQTVLSIADNLLPQIDKEGQTQDDIIDAAIIPHIPLLLKNMATLLEAEQTSVANMNKDQRRKKQRAVISGRLGLSILSRITYDICFTILVNITQAFR